MGQKVKVLKFLTLFAVGGTEKQFVHVSRQLDRSRFDLHVGCMERQGEFLKDLEALNVPIAEYRTSSLYSYKTPLNQLRLARYIRREGIQIVHGYGFYPILFTTPAAKLSRKPVIIASVRDTGVYLTPSKRRALRAMLSLADCVLANSNAVRDFVLSENVRPEVVRVIPNGVIVPERRPAQPAQPAQPANLKIRREFGIPADAPLAIVLCRLTPSKGLEFFIDAAAQVRRKHPDARFLVVGENNVDPHYRPTLERYTAERGLSGSLTFTGWRNDTAELLQGATVSVLPSLSEGFSNTILESMASGLPVIATNVGGNPEMVSSGKTGLLVPARDSAALAHAMIQVFSSPQMARELGDSARLDVQRRFSMESATRQTEELYLSLLDGVKNRV